MAPSGLRSSPGSEGQRRSVACRRPRLSPSRRRDYTSAVHPSTEIPLDAGAPVDGPIDQVRLGGSTRRGTQLAPATKRSLAGVLLLLAWVGLLAIGASGIVAGVMGSVFGADFVAGDFPGVTYTPARCADLQEYAPAGTSCNEAAALHHADETVTDRVAAGVLGTLVFVVWLLARRRFAAGASELGAGLPPGFVATAGLAMFGIVGLATLALGLNLLVLGPGTGAGADLSAAVVSLIVAGVFATKLYR